MLQLQSERFDMVINLEKAPGICALASKIRAWNRYGFRFDDLDGKAESYAGSHDALRIYNDISMKRLAGREWQSVLYEMIGREWNREGYILGYTPKTDVEYGVGLNYKVGSKWPTKSWHLDNWNSLYDKLAKAGYAVSLQPDTDDIEKYIDWINSCQLVVTNDSLGLHVAIALKKKIVALFGPTSHHETHLYGLGTKMLPQGDFDCVPCLRHNCDRESGCLDSINVDDVLQEIGKLFDN